MRFGGLGAPELLLIVLAIVLIFGASKLGDLGGALGKSVKEFKKATQDDDDVARRETTTTPAPPPSITANAASPATAAPLQKSEAVSVGDYRPPDGKPS